VLDIAGDRVVECVLWICLADLRLIGVWIPIVVISRDIFTDSIRNYALRFGYSGFGEKSMMRSGLGRFLTGSPVMRTGYALLKALTFGSLLLFSGLEKLLHYARWLSPAWIETGLTTGAWLAATTAAVCLVRGIPVIIEGIRLIQEKENSPAAHHPSGH
jgi:phosphatidylglycerophosphate synthase